MKSIAASLLLVVMVIAEPPVENRYLPPQQGGNFGAPSSTYGAPGLGNGGSHDRQTAAIFGQQSAVRRPSPQYSAPSNQYGAPSSQFNAPSTQYGAPAAQFNAPSTQYGAPSTQYGAPNAQARQPSALYGAPGQGDVRGIQSPSQQYGAPGAHGAEQSRQYLPPGAGRGGYGDENSEPANYSFEYMVKDEPSGNDFGHRETRQGDRAEGLYYVLLPDGRKQTVEYEADEDGYRPKISYEDTGAGAYGAQGYGGQGGPY